MTQAQALKPSCTVVVDAAGLNCPLPLLKTKKALASLQIGERVYLTATAAQSLRDLSAYAHEAGHRLLCAEEDAGVYYVVIEKVR